MLLEVGKKVFVHTYRDKEVNLTGQVAAIRDTQVEPLKYATFQRNAISRSRYLITVFFPNGDSPCFRSYYHSFLNSVENNDYPVKQGILRRTWQWFLEH